MSISKVLVLTDTHVSNPGSLVKGKDSAALLLRTLDKAAHEHPDAECAVIAGDLVHWGGPGEYAAFRDCLNDRPWPIHLMLGNHDNRQKFVEAFPDHPRMDTGHIQQVVDVGDWRLILLDSHDETFTAPFHSGLLCDARMAWLRKQLDLSADKHLVVFVHHPPIRTFFDGMDEIGLRNASELMKLLKSYQNVHQVIAGHIHRTISGVASGLPVTVFKSTSHQSPLGLGNSSTDLNNDEPPAFGIVLLHDDGVTIHSDDLT